MSIHVFDLLKEKRKGVVGREIKVLTPTNSFNLLPVETSDTKACSFKVETNQLPSPDNATFPPVCIGS